MLGRGGMGCERKEECIARATLAASVVLYSVHARMHTSVLVVVGALTITYSLAVVL